MFMFTGPVRTIPREHVNTPGRRARMAPVVIYLACRCGRRFRSHAASGHTRCPSCAAHVYVPAAARRLAEGRPGELVYDVPSGRICRGA